MPYKLSPSSLRVMEECQRCFWLHFNKNIRRPSMIFPSLPSGMDKIFKFHFDAFRDRKLLPPELHEIKGVKLFDNIELLEIWRDNLKGIQWSDREGNVLRGALDDVLQKGEKLIVLDYKTRGFPLKENTAEYYEDQLDIYNFLLRKNGYKTEDYGYLLFYSPEKINGNGDVVFHTNLLKLDTSVKDAERLFKEALKILKGEMPENSEECEFCKWAENLTAL